MEERKESEGKTKLWKIRGIFLYYCTLGFGKKWASKKNPWKLCSLLVF